MVFIGRAAKEFRESLGLSQRAAAKALDVSAVHLCNVENGKTQPSQSLLDKYRELWGVDLYVFAWCQHGDVEKLPKPLREAASKLADAWQRRIDEIAAEHKKESPS